MPLPKLKFVKRYLPPFLFALSSFFIIKTLFLDYYPDFSQYYWGLKEILQGINPYMIGENIFTTTYPPFVFVLMSPLEILPFFWAQKVWTMFSIIFLIGSLYLIFKINNERFFSKTGFLIGALLFIFYFPIKFTLGMGQINFLILFLTAASIYFLNKSKNYYSGVFLSLSIMIKFFPILFLPYLVILKKGRALFAFFSMSVIIFLFTFLVIKPDINFYFYNDIIPTLFSGWKTDYYNQSLSGFLGRQMDAGFLRELSRILISLVLVGVTFLMVWLKNSKKVQVTNLIFSLLITLSLLINNFSWQHHFVWLLFPFITLFYFIKDKKLNGYYYFILGISFLLVGFNLKVPNEIPLLFTSHVFYGSLMLWGLNLYILARDT